MEKKCQRCGSFEDVVDAPWFEPIFRFGYRDAFLDFDSALNEWCLEKPATYCKRCLYRLVEEKFPQFVKNFKSTEECLNRVKGIIEVCQEKFKMFTFEENIFAEPSKLVHQVYKGPTGTYRGWYISNERKHIASEHYYRPVRCASFYEDATMNFYFLIPNKFCIITPASYSYGGYFREPDVKLEETVVVRESLKFLDFLLENKFTVIGVCSSHFGEGSYTLIEEFKYKNKGVISKINGRELHTPKLVALSEVVGSYGKATWTMIRQSGTYEC